MHGMYVCMWSLCMYVLDVYISMYFVYWYVSYMLCCVYACMVYLRWLGIRSKIFMFALQASYQLSPPPARLFFSKAVYCYVDQAHLELIM